MRCITHTRQLLLHKYHFQQREVQGWCSPNQPPAAAGSNYTRPQFTEQKVKHPRAWLRFNYDTRKLPFLKRLQRARATQFPFIWFTPICRVPQYQAYPCDPYMAIDDSVQAGLLLVFFHLRLILQQLRHGWNLAAITITVTPIFEYAWINV